eukprot:CAMPEP_0197320516 /NCGR_PEP_ID=MMETSP0891-20130614/60409_1 /TAXON_ID=44058 ORGANISM="Aureoumbra lagunensis, Strain CCMP1510" /NCGR_SAMPLE_ID=MMETSP0891 /ASSEMBLY_ACC=CAM_ASM_000534 /LENGTH=273 /DNA_ID=CAMNT_0042811965 /DNA_START=172 /DNA_END=993 /DNA_ORIENTATION=+
MISKEVIDLKKSMSRRKRIVLLGDSITQMSFSDGGFGAALADRYQRRLDVLNRGYSGYNSRWLLELVQNDVFLRDEELGGEDTMLVTIFLGANDASLAEHNFRQHVPIDEFVKNIQSLIAIVNKHSTGNIIIITPPPVGEQQRLVYQRTRYGDQATGILERTNKNAGLYAQALVKIAIQFNLPYIDLWNDMQTQEPTNFGPVFLSDGLHLSPQGYRFLADRLAHTINAHFPSLAIYPDPHTGHFGTSGSSSSLLPHAPWHDSIIAPSLSGKVQ